MDVSLCKTDKSIVNIHHFTGEEIEEWKQKTGGLVQDLQNCECLTFNIGDVEVKLFSSDIDPAPEDGDHA